MVWSGWCGGLANGGEEGEGIAAWPNYTDLISVLDIATILVHQGNEVNTVELYLKVM